MTFKEKVISWLYEQATRYYNEGHNNTLASVEKIANLDRAITYYSIIDHIESMDDGTEKPENKISFNVPWEAD